MPRPHVILALLQGATLATAPAADVLAGHQGTANPADEGWLETPGSGGVAVGPYTEGVPPASAWFIDDTSSAPASGHNYRRDLTPCELSVGNAHGWTMRTCLDVLDDDGLPSIYFGLDTGERRDDLWFTRELSGALVVWLGDVSASGCAPSGLPYTIGSEGGCHVPGFHLFELKYDPVPGTARFTVDGVELNPAFGGYAWTSGLPNVSFAAGSSCDSGKGLFYSVEFEVHATANPEEVVRLGEPPNVDALHPGATTPPAVGKTWDPYVDETAFPAGVTFDVLGIGLLPTNIPSPFGTLLCGTAPPLILGAAPGSDFSLPIPDDCTFVGKTVCAQAGVLLGDGTFVLTNTLDVTIGST